SGLVGPLHEVLVVRGDLVLRQDGQARVLRGSFGECLLCVPGAIGGLLRRGLAGLFVPGQPFRSGLVRLRAVLPLASLGLPVRLLCRSGGGMGCRCGLCGRSRGGLAHLLSSRAGSPRDPCGARGGGLVLPPCGGSQSAISARYARTRAVWSARSFSDIPEVRSDATYCFTSTSSALASHEGTATQLQSVWAAKSAD